MRGEQQNGVLFLNRNSKEDRQINGSKGRKSDRCWGKRKYSGEQCNGRRGLKWQLSPMNEAVRGKQKKRKVYGSE